MDVADSVPTYGQVYSIEADTNHQGDESNRYRYRLRVPDKVQALAAVLKSTAQILVFEDPRVAMLEHKGIHILECLFDTFVKNTTLLPLDFQELLKDGSAKKELIVADFVAGMTDSYATEYFERLFQPRAGSFYKFV
jgi:dGTPase